MSTMTVPKTKGSWLGSQQTAKTDHAAVSEDQIQRRAYEIFVAREGKPGDALQDWLQAKRELEAKQVRR